MIISFFMLAASCAGDLFLSGVSPPSWHTAPLFAPVFLIYAAVRRGLRESLGLVAVYVVMTHPLTGAGAAGVGLSHAAVLFALSALRRRLFAEAYLTTALWAAAGVFLIRSGVILAGGTGPAGMAGALPFFLLSAVLAGLVAVPAFMLWDRLFDLLLPPLHGRRHVLGRHAQSR